MFSTQRIFPIACKASGMVIDNRYQLLPELGIKKRNYSTLYKAKDKETTRWVTVKFTEAEKTPELFATHKRKWYLISHPNLLSCLNLFELTVDLGEGEKKYSTVVNEYLDGAPISHHYIKFEDRKFCKQAVSEILSGLDFLHRLGLVHRDVKCSNIFFYNREKGGLGIKLTDLVMLGEEGEAPVHFVGTPEYTAPEVFRKEKLNCKSDYWSLGCVLYEIFTRGSLPFGTRLDVGGLEELKERIMNQAYKMDKALSQKHILILDQLLDKSISTRLADSGKIIGFFN